MAKLLLCDDESSLVRSLGRVLRGNGHEVVGADGPEGRRLLQTEPFDLVITDIVMPEVDGYEIIRAATERRPPISVIAMSGNAEIADAVRAMHEGARDFLVKPFDMEALEKAIDKVLTGASHSGRKDREASFNVWTGDGVSRSIARQLRVFLCHSSSDKAAVRTLADQLEALGIDVWLDDRRLLPGQRWDEEIPKAMRRTDVAIVCITHHSLTKRGYMQKEIVVALDIAQEEPEGSIFLIPARLELCRLPDRLRNHQWVSLFEPDGFERLVQALRTRAKNISGSARA